MFLLQPNEVAVISQHGYHANRKTSIEATEWLEFLNYTENLTVKHGRNGKEQKVGRFFVDGVDESTKTVFEYNGAVFHGCPHCMKPDDLLPFSNKTMKEAYEEFNLKVQMLQKDGYTVRVMWSCDWQIRREEADVEAFLMLTDFKQPLSAKDAFRGGRTNAAKLFYEVEGREKIHHIDVVSLYPTVCKYDVYPVSHSEIVVSNFKDIREYFGLVKCVVEAPDNDLFPVLPMVVKEKLVFALCRTCALFQKQVTVIWMKLPCSSILIFFFSGSLYSSWTRALPGRNLVYPGAARCH